MTFRSKWKSTMHRKTFWAKCWKSMHLSVLNMSQKSPGIVLYFIILCYYANGLRITGNWNSEKQRFIIATKFGFQRIDPLNAEQSRGFIFGNVTSLSDTNGNY